MMGPTQNHHQLPAQTVGRQQPDAVAQAQQQVAVAAANEGARYATGQARNSFLEVKAYIAENPGSVKVACFIVGLILILFSILGLFNLFGAAFEPREYLSNFYNVVFGVVICICDGKESWMKSCGDVQTKLFKYAYALATQTGRAFFYLYVGSMTMLVLPDSWLWIIVYIILGGVLCLLAGIQLFMAWCGPCCGCEGNYGQMQGESSGGSADNGVQ